MERKLFCEISPFTYRLSMEKEILKRHIRDLLQNTRFAHERSETTLPVLIYRHNSLIRRRLGNTFQLRLWVEDEYLCGELRSEQQQPHTFHIHAENEFFSREDGIIYRNGQVFRDTIDRTTGRCLDSQLIRNNHARVMYDLPPSITVQEKQQVPK